MQVTIDANEFVNNSNVIINDISRPFTAETEYYQDVYIGISATSVCSVDLEIESAYTEVGDYEILTLTNQGSLPNMHALHLHLEKYEGGAGMPSTRVFSFNMNVNTCCGYVFRDTSFQITQHKV